MYWKNSKVQISNPKAHAMFDVRLSPLARADAEAALEPCPHEFQAGLVLGQ
jgi:hypothetical protein